MAPPPIRLLRTGYAIYDAPNPATVPGGGGGILLAATRAQLTTAIDAAAASDGSIAYTQDVPGYWSLNKSSSATVDGVKYVATSNGVGRWVREQVPILKYVTQAVFEINPSTGNDTNDGLTTGTAIKTLAEWWQRTQGQFAQNTQLHLTASGAWPGSDSWEYGVSCVGGSGVNLAVMGSSTVARAGILSAAAVQNPAVADGAATATDPGAVSWNADVGRWIVTSGGTRAIVQLDLGGNKAQVSSWVTQVPPANFVDTGAPGGGTAYNVVTFTQLPVIRATVAGDGLLFFVDLQITGSASGIEIDSDRVQWCSCRFASFVPVNQQKSSWSYLKNCDLPHGMFVQAGQYLLQWGSARDGIIAAGVAYVSLESYLVHSGSSPACVQAGAGATSVDLTPNLPGGVVHCRDTGRGVGLYEGTYAALALRGGSVSIDNAFGASCTYALAVRSRGTIYVKPGYTPVNVGFTSDLNFVDHPTDIIAPFKVGAAVPANYASTPSKTYANFNGATLNRYAQSFLDYGAIIGS